MTEIMCIIWLVGMPVALACFILANRAPKLRPDEKIPLGWIIGGTILWPAFAVLLAFSWIWAQIMMMTSPY